MPISLIYLIAVTMLSIALGIQIIVLPWLVLDFLALSSVWVGWVQAAVLLPNLSLLLLGGLMADKGKGMLWLAPVLLVNIVVHLFLYVMLKQYWLSITLLLFYALLLGVTSAFIQPWREYLLNIVFYQADGGLQTHVARSTLCLYIGQAAGIAIASLMNDIDVSWLVLVQMTAVALAAISFWCLIRQLANKKRTDTSGKESVVSQENAEIHQHSIRAGLREVWHSRPLRSLTAIAAFNGFFHIGVFIVVLPLIVQQLYGESVDFYSGLQFTFVAGTVTATLVVLFRRFLDSPGRRIIFGLLYGGVILLAISAKPTLTGLFILLFCWGLVVGVSVNMGRSVLQSLAFDVSRGRIISIYQLALFGSAPLGALFAGYAIDSWGVVQLLKISGIASVVAFFLFFMTRSLWEVETSSES